MKANEMIGNISIIGLDLAKTCFRFKFNRLVPCTVGMECCGSIRYWGCKVQLYSITINKIS